MTYNLIYTKAIFKSNFKSFKILFFYLLQMLKYKKKSAFNNIAVINNIEKCSRCKLYL